MVKKAIVLDKITKNINHKQKNALQAISTSNFSILELFSDDSCNIQDQISTEDMIARRIRYENLTSTAKQELERAIEKIIDENPKKFVNFYNTARPIGIRRHQLDLLPMIGKKHRKAIIEYLRKNPKFETFEDIKKIEMLPDPKYVIIKRIVDEITDGPEIKYHLFTMPYFNK